MDVTQKCIDSEEDAFNDEEEWSTLMDSICNTQKEDHIDYIMGGVRIKFPKTAYKSQELLMGCMIEGVQKSENCLLESPTGTGKTLAILCSLLAWQVNCKRKKDWGHTIDEATLKTGCTCGFMQGDPTEFVIMQKFKHNEGWVLQKYSYEYVEVEESVSADDDNDTGSNSPKKKKNEVKRPKQNHDEERNERNLCRFCIRSNFKRSRVPVIYYSTRTISQVDQVVKELKSTAYCAVNMTILAGRSTYCSNLDVTQPNGEVDAECQKLRENYARNKLSKFKKLKECDYFQGGIKGPNEDIYSDFTKVHETTQTAWDIEDLKTYSRRNCGCAYYGSKILQPRAEIVFCTYNYLLHPRICSSSKIDLKNSVLVFDEAHNIEDLCRNVSSISISQNYIDGTVIPAFEDALKVGQRIPLPPGISPILNEFLTLFLRFSKWIERHSEKIVFNIKWNQEDCKEFAQDEIVRQLNELGLGADSLFDLGRSCAKLEEAVLGKQDDNKSPGNDDGTIITDETINGTATISPLNLNEASTCSSTAENNDNEKIKFKFSLIVIQYLSNIVDTLKLIFENGNELSEDYKAIVVKKVNNVGTFKTITFSNEFNIICLNPAIAFKQLKNSAHSVIVTSGTLYPLDSFESELNTPFVIKLSAPHVIESSQVMSSVAKYGPENIPLCFNKGGQQIPECQDELGRVILNICKIVPHGVLLFFPSYGWLEHLKLRWEKFPQSCPMLQQLRLLKKVYFEDSKRSKEEFKNYMDDYRSSIEDNSSGGCILFAVFRGKVSEGIDFKDDQARAVLTVGIPFSNPGDTEIRFKRQYNDSMRKSKNRKLLSGSEWYTTQAFRALNQAFGRCVRHKNDWGSIILLEDRMTTKTKHLSEWVRRDLKFYSEFHQFETTLKKFVKEKLSEEPLKISKIEGFTNEPKISAIISPIAPQLNPYKIETYPSPQQISISEMKTQKVKISEMVTQIVAVNPSGIFTKAEGSGEAERSLSESQCYSKGEEFYKENNNCSESDSSINEVLGPSDDESDEECQYNNSTLIASSQSSSLISRLRKSIYVLSPLRNSKLN